MLRFLIYQKWKQSQVEQLQEGIPEMLKDLQKLKYLANTIIKI